MFAVWTLYWTATFRTAYRHQPGKSVAKVLDTVRRRAALTSAIPNNWQGFLRVNENKTELFQLLAEYVATIDVEGK